MKNALAGAIIAWILAMMFFPEEVGEAAHKAFIGMKAGWEQVKE